MVCLLDQYEHNTQDYIGNRHINSWIYRGDQTVKLSLVRSFRIIAWWHKSMEFRPVTGGIHHRTILLHSIEGILNGNQHFEARHQLNHQSCTSNL
ncbi:hypothetical protein RCL_jg13330.t1 [Rhizophagus clarus]|uniref:Uncharacterized protein n=1 Tax=Rhizophagus clarus TaxID=94130 RepID=A0A8H3QS70_9GLOM|nr:hypothetical protein RCL_jg13330.t1 [Rhizophagus clarus]